MTLSYRFITVPQNSIVMTVSDGKRQLSVTEPIDATPDMTALRNGDLDATERFFRENATLKNKLDRTARILNTALQQIDTTNTSIDRPTGILEYFNRVIQEETALHGTRRGDKISKYRAGLKAFTKFLEEVHRTDETVDNLDSAMMTDFDRWMQRRQLLLTTREFYIRRISALYSRAVRAGLVLDAHPFDAPLRALTSLRQRADSTTLTPAPLSRQA